MERISDADPDMRMPPSDHGPALTTNEMELVAKWIDQGAEWEQHWSFVPPRPSNPPAVHREHWPRDPLDQFVLARLEAAGLAPAAQANRTVWLRRVTFDLTGLPPTADEFTAFQLDNRPDSYERVVDRLLASPHFGERWASNWLDLARYADTMGFERDPDRPIWPYRDWLIRAFNDDMPFDEFTIKQLAGDLLPDATVGDRVATAFHRNTQTNTEGGTDDEEFRLAAVLDRVSTTWQVWQGSTFRCTQCHSHPYDPFRHEEFYKFVAFFNTTRDADLNDDAPRLQVPSVPETWDDASRLDAAIRSIRRELYERLSALANDAQLWRPLPCDAATASDTANLAIRQSTAEKPAEVVASGTVAANSTFRYEFELERFTQLAAVQIDALPRDLAEAVKTPEAGFVVSKLEGWLIPADGSEPLLLEFGGAVADEIDPLFPPESSFRDDLEGWSDYTRSNYPRRAAFVLKKPIAVSAGGRLRLSLQFKQSDSGGGALYIQRARFAASESGRWSEELKSKKRVRLQQQLAALVEERTKMQGIALPVMAEQDPAFARRTFTFTRGNWLDKDAEVQAGTPEVMPPLPPGVRADRLAMARWLVAPENPLTSRVMVNRLWQELFGLGIVETAEDFGTSGTLPSHPELLDHLALRFQAEYRWSIKKMLRTMVLSSTYRQESSTTAEARDKDPRNVLLSRGPRTRLSAEMVRDQALVLSGRFSKKMFGPPVMPPQPEGIWRSAYSAEKWTTSEGEDRYRRAVYTYWKRTSPYPSMVAFDAPSRDICIARRQPTNTPLQALVTLNDQTYIELAQAWADQMESTGAGPREQIASSYRAATGRSIEVAKLEALVKLYKDAAAAFEENPDEAKQLAATRGRYALAVVANALFNSDELLTK
jgi:hypothetical protein